MKLTVIGHAGQPVENGLSASFSAAGGSIGSSVGCDLTLNDCEGRISRLHAVLSHRPDGWHVRNVSSTRPIEVNSHPLDPNQEIQLQDGDLLRIDAYLLRSEAKQGMQTPERTAINGQSPFSPQQSEVRTSASGSAENPFADLLGGKPLSTLEPADKPLLHLEDSGSAGKERSWIAPSYFGQVPESGSALFAPQAPRPGYDRGVSESVANRTLDPLALFGAPLHGGDLLENLGPSALDQPARDSMGLAQPPAPDSGFSSLAAPVDIGRTALHLGLPAELPPAPSAPPAPPTLPASPAPSTASHPPAVERRAVAEAPDSVTAPAKPQGNRAPVPDKPAVSREPLNVPAPASSAAAPTARQTPAPRPEPLEPLSQSEMLAERAPPIDPVEIGQLARRLVQMREQRQPPMLPAEAKSEATQAVDRAMQSFIQAAGLEPMAVASWPLEQRMAQLGRLFRLFADGTVRLLSSRALVKREVRAEVTRVTQEANNPFKVLPSGEAVMIQMFGQHLPGFLCAEQAIGDALADLQHHQLGMLAGTRAALLGLVRQLDPQAWERKIEPSGLLDRLFPQRVAARRWQHYNERYRSVLALAQANDFHRLFGESFLRAYEDEISRCSEAEPRLSEGAPA
jgi:FHA domain-containing protein